MTRLAGPSGGGKYIKPPKPAPEPKRVYIKIKPAPKAPVVNVKTGNNPRGVAIVTKSPPSKTLTTGNNPRGVAIKNVRTVTAPVPKKIISVKLPPKSSGGGILGIGAISPSSILHTVEHIPSDVVHISKTPFIHNTLKDAVGLVPGSIEGVGTLAHAVAHDALGVVTGATHVGPGATAVEAPAQHSELGAIAKSAWKGNVVKALVVDHNPSEALRIFKANPLNTALSVAGDLGVVGRVAGIAARTGLVGSKLKDAAGLARDDRVLVPGVKGETRHYHPNVIVSAAQHAMDKAEGHRPQYLNTRKLNKRVDDVHGVSRAVASKHEQDVLDAQAKAIKGDHGKKFSRTPKGRQAAADVASYAAQGVATGDHAKMVAELHDLRGKIQHELDNKTHATKAGRRAAEAHVKNIDTFLADPDVAAVHEIAENYAARQRGEIDPQMVERGLLSKDQAEKAHLVPYVAAGHMADEGARVLEKPERTVRAVAFTQASAEAKRAADMLHDAKLVGGKMTERDHVALRSAAMKAERHLNKAVQSERYTEGVLTGRRGRKPPLKAKEADRMNRYLSKTNDAKINLRAARVASNSERADRNALTASYLKAAGENMRDARDQARDLKVYDKEKLKPGTVVKDVKVGMNRGKPVYAVRRVTSGEIEQHMRGNGINPDHVAYVNLKAPREPGEDVLPSGTNLSSRGDSAIRSRTAREITTGNYKPGHTALADSQVSSMRRIDRAKGFDRLVQQVTVHDAKGKVVSGTKDEIDELKAKYEKSAGVKLVPVALHAENDVAKAGAQRAQAFVDDQGNPLKPEDAGKKQRFGLVPKTAMDRYKSHVQGEQPSYFGSVGVATRAFRNTVLPFSPKWLVGNVVEAAIRSAVVGAGPGDAALFHSVVKTMRDGGDHQSADELEAYANGQHYSMAQRANEKMTGAGALNKPPPHFLEVARDSPGLKQFLDVYHGIVQKIYGFNHRVEQSFSHASMGVHMRQELHEFGNQWTLAASKQDEWMQKLSKGYADPELARDAGRFVQQTLGKYDRFSPGMKKYVNNIAPFAPWYWNALRFVYATMPGLHPLAQSVLLSAAQSQQATYAQQMKDVGGLGEQYGGLSVGSLNSDLPVGKSAYLDVGRFTPWGAFSDGPVNFLSSQILPQAQGAFLAAAAKDDPYGRPLKDKNGDVTSESQAAGVALNEILTSIAGPTDMIHRIADKGSSEYSASTLWKTQIKPGSSHGTPSILNGVNRVLNPARPTYLNPTATESGGSSTGVTGVAGTTVVGRAGKPVVGRSGKAVVGR